MRLSLTVAGQSVSLEGNVTLSASQITATHTLPPIICRSADDASRHRRRDYRDQTTPVDLEPARRRQASTSMAKDAGEQSCPTDAPRSGGRIVIAGWFEPLTAAVEQPELSRPRWRHAHQRHSNIEADATVGEPIHDILRKRWAKQVPTPAFGSFAVVAIDGGGCVHLQPLRGRAPAPRR